MKVVKRILPFFLILGLFFLLFFLPPRLIKVSKIECSTQYGTCPGEMQSMINNLQFTNLHEAKKKIGKIMKNYYYISDFSTQFKLPGTLKVEILVRKPVYALNQKDTENFDLVDRDGNILAVSDNSTLPTVITVNSLGSVGEMVTPKELFALKLIAGVFSMYQVGRGQMSDSDLAVALPMGLKVIFPLGEGLDHDVILGSLRAIVGKIEVAQLDILEPGNYKEIDLRFRNPVLR